MANGPVLKAGAFIRASTSIILISLTEQINHVSQQLRVFQDKLSHTLSLKLPFSTSSEVLISTLLLIDAHF